MAPRHAFRPNPSDRLNDLSSDGWIGRGLRKEGNQNRKSRRGLGSDTPEGAGREAAHYRTPSLIRDPFAQNRNEGVTDLPDENSNITSVILID